MRMLIPLSQLIEKDFIFVGFVGVHIITNSQDVNIARVSIKSVPLWAIRQKEKAVGYLRSCLL